jgi:aspartate/methionine/tyrosine aminotransferase
MIHPRAEKLFGESAFEVLGRARKLEAQGRDVVHLEVGQPDFPTPEHICEAAIRAIRDGHTGYGPSQGLPELREAIAEKAGELRGVELDPANVVVAPGAKALIFYAVNALAGPGDEVIYPDPGFPAYQSVVAHSGATPVPLPLREEKGFRFDIDEFRSLVTDRTRLVILNSPQNPTGGVLTLEDLEVIAEEAERRDFFVLSDEMYLHFCYDAPFETIVSVDGMLSRTILLDGFSKSYSMTGWRLGYAVLPESLISTFDLYNVNIASCACTFNQKAAVEALRGPQDCVREMVSEFRRRRDWLVAALNELPGIRCVTPGGAFYAFPNVTDTGLSSETLAARLLDEAGVATLAGNSFGPAGDGFVRLSYANSLENLERAIERFRDFLKQE